MNNNINSSSSAGYEMRGSGDGRSKKQSMAELKLRRLQELNVRLKEDLDRRRIPVSEAANDLIAFTDKEPKDFMVPSRWGTVRSRWSLSHESFEQLSHQESQSAEDSNSPEDGQSQSQSDETSLAAHENDHEADPLLVAPKQREDPYAPQQSQGCCAIM